MAGQPLPADDVRLAEIFGALSQPVRLQILRILAAEGALLQKVLLDRVQVSQPNGSRHLAALLRSGLVLVRRDGRCSYWSIGTIPPAVGKFFHGVHGLPAPSYFGTATV
jgi:hypothetical protein